ncbi:heavy metal translocating P-type ATPase [Lewinella sp. W8]|uniref:heavy metal translocating P-type ATPase n=1 Tax=Lewinella sp. W8 TaxID=2528208 RepID=UPI00106792FD|nr:heavy metal translocating P-type ATPase [Lewinella sp. W8]MTB52593.1 heavy metal translocating P-type ATPase [Lewinella sp. W8]
MEAHDHSSDNSKVELAVAIGSGLFWGAGLLVGLMGWGGNLLPTGLFATAIVLGGFFTVGEAFEALRHGRFEIDFLMLVAAAGAAALGNWSEGALLLFLFSLAHALEHHALQRARKSIDALSEIAPETAFIRQGGELVEVPADSLKPGDRVYVKPNSRIPADAVVREGESAVNQASITGESIPVEKYPLDGTLSEEFSRIPPAHQVFSGTINGSGALEIEVARLPEDSTLSRLIQLVREAEEQQSPTQRFADRFERVFVPVVLVFVVLLLFAFLVIDEPFSSSFYRAMAVLVAASPCALAISTPSAVLAGIARAARGGVLIKGGKPLENLGTLRAIAFDKTGTLTEGKPRLTEVIPLGDHTEESVLRPAVAVESLSDHPLAAAIVTGGRERLGEDYAFPEPQDIEALTARGVRARVEEARFHLGNRRLATEITGRKVPKSVDDQMAALESRGNTVMLLLREAEYVGIIAVMDVPRPEARPTLQKLTELGLERLVMLTGDHQLVADAVARQLGITDPMGGLLPEDKVAIVEHLKGELGQVAMIGDGVNDAPAMARSTVSIAMGAAGSAVALETSDVALMADKLDKLPFVVGLSRKARRIIVQNVFISLGMVAILVPLTLFGVASMGPAVVAHEGSTLVVVFNALRLLAYRER